MSLLDSIMYLHSLFKMFISLDVKILGLCSLTVLWLVDNIKAGTVFRFVVELDIKV